VAARLTRKRTTCPKVRRAGDGPGTPLIESDEPLAMVQPSAHSAVN